MTPLRSSNLVGYEYDAERQELKITFHSGRTYTYGSVPQDIAEGLGQADSPGRYFNNSIKGVYAER